jgi:hypothetical protein
VTEFYGFNGGFVSGCGVRSLGLMAISRVVVHFWAVGFDLYNRFLNR